MCAILSLGAAGCFGIHHDGGGGGGGVVVVSDSPRPLGAQGLTGYRVRAGAASELPASDRGFIVTANGNGGYRLSWGDFVGSRSDFSGTVSTDGQFDPTQLIAFSGNENIALSADGGTFTFESAPGAALDGVDMVSSTDPIYIDVLVDGSHAGFNIYFTGAESGLLLTSDYDPVAFTSP